MADTSEAEQAVDAARADFARCPCARHADDLDAAISDLTRTRAR